MQDKGEPKEKKLTDEQEKKEGNKEIKRSGGGNENWEGGKGIGELVERGGKERTVGKLY